MCMCVQTHIEAERNRHMHENIHVCACVCTLVFVCTDAFFKYTHVQMSTCLNLRNRYSLNNKLTISFLLFVES